MYDASKLLFALNQFHKHSESSLLETGGGVDSQCLACYNGTVPDWYCSFKIMWKTS